MAHDAENLQFYLWFHDYSRRFFAASSAEQALSPPWEEDLTQAIGNDPGPGMLDKKAGQGLKFNFDFDAIHIPLSPISDQHSILSSSVPGNPVRAVEFANAQTGLKWQSCELGVHGVVPSSNCGVVTIQPFRSEINRIITHYVAAGSARELNLSQKNRTDCVTISCSL